MRANVKRSIANVLPRDLVHPESRQLWIARDEDEAEMVSNRVGGRRVTGLLKRAVGG